MSITLDVPDGAKPQTLRIGEKPRDRELENLVDDFLGIETCLYCEWLIIKDGIYICTDGEIKGRQSRGADAVSGNGAGGTSKS